LHAYVRWWADTRQYHLINFLTNSPAGTYFLGSIDASSEVASANMLADLLEKQIDKIGKEHVVQIVTDNGANFKVVVRNLMDRIPHLFWTPCAAHCLDLLLEDIGKIKEFNSCINMAKYRGSSTRMVESTT
jgi:N-methylhydantoinase B/oxoprolinase/acetone carboxylase alpha subunit